MNDKELFDVARELIRHEDGLVNNRVTWLLVLQGFLFTAFVNGISLFEKFTNPPSVIFCITAGLVLICMLGIVLSLTALNVVKMELKRMQEVKTWWENTGLEWKFPPVAGERGEGCFPTRWMPWVLVWVWSMLILLLLTGLWLRGCG